MASRLILGTAQFGMPYGVLGNGRSVPANVVHDILRWSESHGIVGLDTAIAYGESETVLGEAGARNFRVITKLPPLPPDIVDVSNWVRSQVSGSLRRLRLDRVDTILLHHPADILSESGSRLAEALTELREAGTLQKIGVSIYDPSELESITQGFPIEVVQCPMNAFDQRLVTSGWLQRLAVAGIEILTRSAFLQGLLLAPPEKIPEKFLRWPELWMAWWTSVSEYGDSAATAALACILQYEEVSGVVVGCENLDQLVDLRDSESKASKPAPCAVGDAPAELIDPRTWDHL